jgi:hypothetical protein
VEDSLEELRAASDHARNNTDVALMQNISQQMAVLSATHDRLRAEQDHIRRR